MSRPTPFISVVFGEYVHRLGLAGGVSTGVLACGLIVAVAALNLLGTRISGASQGVASALKGGVFLVIVVILFLSPRGADVVQRPRCRMPPASRRSSWRSG